MTKKVQLGGGGDQGANELDQDEKSQIAAHANVTVAQANGTLLNTRRHVAHKMLITLRRSLIPCDVM